MTEIRVWLTSDEAEAMLPYGDRIHVFTNSMMGADWDRAAVLDMLRKPSTRSEMAGSFATKMGHGLAVWDEPQHYWLVETSEEGTK